MDTNVESIICIPAYKNSDEIWNLALQDFEKNCIDWYKSSTDYSWGYMKMISKLATD